MSSAWSPLRMEDLPVTREFEPNNYANAQKLRVLYFVSASALTPDQRTEFIHLLQTRAFCRPANNPSPTASPLFQSLLVTGRFTWPKWMVLGTVYGVDHEELAVVKKIVESLFGHAKDLTKPPGFEAEKHGFEDFLRDQPLDSSSVSGQDGVSDKCVQTVVAAPPPSRPSTTDPSSPSPTSLPSTASKAASESAAEPPSAADFAALIRRLEAIETTIKQSPKPQNHPDPTPDPGTEQSPLLERVQALEDKNTRLEKLVAAQKTRTAYISQHYSAGMSRVREILKHCMVHLPRLDASVANHALRLGKQEIRTESLAGRMRKLDLVTEKFPPTVEAAPLAETPDYTWIDEWHFDL